MATVTTVLGPRRWRHALARRDRDFTLFHIPPAVVTAAGVRAGTKRQVRIRLSTGRTLAGFCSVTSGTEVYIPIAFREALRQAAWFECEVVGEETAEATSLRWADPAP